LAPDVCDSSGKQTRICDDFNRCGTYVNKPETSRTCEYGVKEEVKILEEKPESVAIEYPAKEKEKPFMTLLLDVLIGLPVMLLVSVALLLTILLGSSGFVVYRRRKKRRDLDYKRYQPILLQPHGIRLKEYIKRTLELGFSKKMIRDALIKAGWKKELVDHTFKIIKEENKRYLIKLTIIHKS